MRPAVILAGALQWDIRRGDVAHNLGRMESLLREAAGRGATLLVLPEMWTTSFVPEAPAALVAQSDAAVERLRQLSQEHGIVVVGSALEAAAGSFFNRALVFDRGKEVLSYRKIHLFSPTGEPRFFQAGASIGLAATSVGRLGVLICYDIRFPELSRWLFTHHVQTIAVPAQWPTSRAVHWNTLMQARAIENQCFVIGANRCGLEKPLRGGAALEFPGNSQVVNPTGEVVAAGEASEGSVLGEISLRQIATVQRLMPLRRDLRPAVYARIWDGAAFTRQDAR